MTAADGQNNWMGKLEEFVHTSAPGSSTYTTSQHRDAFKHTRDAAVGTRSPKSWRTSVGYVRNGLGEARIRVERVKRRPTQARGGQ